MIHFNSRIGNNNQSSKSNLKRLRESDPIVPRSEIDVGMVAPSADAISKQDLEDEKIKLAVLKSTSPSNRLEFGRVHLNVHDN